MGGAGTERVQLVGVLRQDLVKKKKSGRGASQKVTISSVMPRTDGSSGRKATLVGDFVENARVNSICFVYIAMLDYLNTVVALTA